MMNPDLRLLLADHISRYSLVTATAKRARAIVTEAEEQGEIIEEKPISMAIDELLAHKFKIVEPKEIRTAETTEEQG